MPHGLYIESPGNPVILTQEEYNHHPCFTDGKTETQRGQLSQDPPLPGKWPSQNLITSLSVTTEPAPIGPNLFLTRHGTKV